MEGGGGIAEREEKKKGKDKRGEGEKEEGEEIRGGVEERRERGYEESRLRIII